MKTFLSVSFGFTRLKQEEAEKDRLCDELNTLVLQSASLQMQKLEELKVNLLSMGGLVGVGHQPQAASSNDHPQHPAATAAPPVANAVAPPSASPQPVSESPSAEEKAASELQAKKEAKEARSRHIEMKGRGGVEGKREKRHIESKAAQQSGGFSGFDT